MRRYLPDLIKLVWEGKINPGKVFDLNLPLDEVAEGDRAMDERRRSKPCFAPRPESEKPLQGECNERLVDRGPSQFR